MFREECRDYAFWYKDLQSLKSILNEKWSKIYEQNGSEWYTKHVKSVRLSM